MEQQLQKLTQAILVRGELLEQLQIQCAAIQASVEEMKPIRPEVKTETKPAEPVVSDPLLRAEVPQSVTPPAQASSSRSLATGELDALMLTGCSMNGPNDDTDSRTSAFMPDTAPSPPSTAALLDVAITSPEPTDITILVRDGTGDLTPTPSGAAVHPIDLGDEHVPNLSNRQLEARKVFDRMCGTDGVSYGFSTNSLILTTCCPDESSIADIAVVDRATRRRERAHRVLILARLENSCGAMEFRPPWPPPTQVDVACNGVKLEVVNSGDATITEKSQSQLFKAECSSSGKCSEYSNTESSDDADKQEIGQLSDVNVIHEHRTGEKLSSDHEFFRGKLKNGCDLGIVTEKSSVTITPEMSSQLTHISSFHSVKEVDSPEGDNETKLSYVSDGLDDAIASKGMNNYSGYGASSGKPGEENTYADSEVVYQCLETECKESARKTLSCMGNLWTVAIHCILASRLPRWRGVVLLSAILSGLRVVCHVNFTSCFDIYQNVKKIKKMKCPVLVIRGTDDVVVNWSHGSELWKLAKEPYDPGIEGGGHCNLELYLGVAMLDDEQCYLHPETSFAQDTVLSSYEVVGQNEQLPRCSSSMMVATPPMQWRAKLQTGFTTFAKLGRPPRPKPPVKHHENESNSSLDERSQEAEMLQVPWDPGGVEFFRKAFLTGGNGDYSFVSA